MIRHAIWIFSLVLCFAGTSLADTVVLISADDESSPAIRSIITGIESASSGTTFLVAINNLEDAIELLATPDDPTIIIGSRLIKQTADLPFSIRAIGGGFYEPIVNPISIPSISLYPSIPTLVSEIKKTGLDLSRLITVTPSAELKTKLETYSDALNESGVEQIIVSSTGERSTARAWFELLRDIDPKTDALYISDATYLDSSGAYKAILEAAWRRNILVVSALPQYARRGVSIGFIPDLVAYGSLLVDTADGLDATEDATNQPSDDINTDVLIRVFNQRTLQHIGYSMPDDIDRLNRDDLVIE